MVATLLLAAAAQTNAVPLGRHFECEMRPGNMLHGGDASADDRQYLPGSWRLEIAVPLGHGERVRYIDGVLGSPIDVQALWGYRQRDFRGNGQLVHSEFDWWGVEYTLVFAEAGEAMIWNKYLRTEMREGRPRSRELHGVGACHEIVTYRSGTPS
jgi:hypothetical protein